MMRVRHRLTACVLASVLALVVVSRVAAHAPSGAIFTTLEDGSEVNFNQYPSKEDVYLDGGPGPGAPQDAAGLDDGTYYFQVTDPSGKTLLSTDPLQCRQFIVAGGIITGVVPQPDGCEHSTGLDLDHGAATVQLFPYLDTPNNGGVYKVWVTRIEDIDTTAPGNKHGFVPSHSKTDNFKVGDEPIVEIDTRFHDSSGALVDGLGVTWLDTNGASNKKWSYWAPNLQVFHEAHVEAVEAGSHRVVINHQPGCDVSFILLPDGTVAFGPQTVNVRIRNLHKDLTVFIDVYCE